MAEPVKTIRATEARQTVDADRDPAAYLLSHGWKLYEGDPKREVSKWLDPTKPHEDVESKVKVGTKKLPGNKGVENIMQTLVTCAAWPIYRAAAVQVQLERDEEASKK